MKASEKIKQITLKTRILIADSHTIVREAICSGLQNEDNIEIVGQANNGREAIKLTQELQPDVIIMETSMPNLNSIEATRKIVHEFPEIKIIALSAHSDRRSVCEMLKAGASGYLPKTCSYEELICAIQNVIMDRTYLCSQISALVVSEYLQHSADQKKSPYYVLTEREREVLQMIAEGRSTKVIARDLNVSPKTIEWHRSQLMKKLHIESIAEIVKYAISEGLTSVALQRSAKG